MRTKHPLVKVGVHAAKTNLSRLIEQARAGKEVIITRDDEPVVRLVPFEQPARRESGTLQERFGHLDVDRLLEPLPEEELRLWESEGD
jgi:prevent-host-death family protein